MKRILIVGLALAAALTGCGPSDVPEDGIERIVSDFYSGSYEYRKTLTSRQGGKVTERTVTEGKVVHDPYREYVHLVRSSLDLVWSEAYYYGSGKAVDALLRTPDGWQNTKTEQSAPYGYGQTLTFSSEGEQDVDGVATEVYSAQYEVEFQKDFGLDEPLTAVVTQVYYVDKDKQVLTRLETDLTDYSIKNTMANDMAVNGLKLREAEERVAEREDYTQQEVLEISHFGEEISIELPETS